MSLKLFARLTKVDEQKRLVYGRATEEVVDRAGEIMDYATSKPYFEKWSGDIAKATDGKSVGNLRAMHNNVAAGKLTTIDFLDEEKAIDICAKVVDDGEWNKVLEGVYTGFSIGGDYVKRWNDQSQAAKRYTADPCEVSLVDLPCLPSALFFDVQKADGSVMRKAFKAPAEPEPVTADAFSDEVAELAKAGSMSLEEMLSAIRKAKAAKDDGKKFADPKNEKYPLDTEEHIRAAWSYINQKKNADEYSAEDLQAVKDRIVAAWKAEIDKDGPPAAADKAAEPVLTKDGRKVVVGPDNLTRAARVALHKGMYSVSSLASLLASVQYLQQSSAREEAAENDTASTLPAGLLDWLKQGGELLTAMVAEEVAELTDADGMVDCSPYYYIECAAAAEDLGKALAETGIEDVHKALESVLEKAGARNSAADHGRIQKAHDLLAELGAGCKKDASDGELDAEKAAHAQTLGKLNAADETLMKAQADSAAVVEQLTKVTSERDEIQKALDTATAGAAELQKKYDEQGELLQKMKTMPTLPKGVLKAIEKSHDMSINEAEESAEDDVSPILKADGTVDQLATEMKKARRTGVVVVRG